MPCRPVRSSGPGSWKTSRVGHVELRHQQFEHVRVDGLLDLEPYGRAEAAPLQLLLERLEQVLGVVLLDLEVLVAGHPEGVVLQHLHAREQPVEVRRDDVLERHEPLVAELDEAREDRRHLDPREVLLAGVGVADGDGEVEREPGDVREGVSRVDRQRRQHRPDALGEEPASACARRRRAPSSAAGGCPRRRGRPGCSWQIWPLALHQLARLAPDRLQQLARHHPAGRLDGDAGLDPPLSPATRTMKNSSRLLAKIARNRVRSRSGSVGSSASSSTRLLNRSHDSSRSRNRSSGRSS